MRNLDIESNAIGYAGFDLPFGSYANRDARLKLLLKATQTVVMTRNRSLLAMQRPEKAGIPANKAMLTASLVRSDA
jgi:hypothetical protein